MIRSFLVLLKKPLSVSFIQFDHLGHAFPVKGVLVSISISFLGDGVKVTAENRDFTLGEDPILSCHIVGTSPSRFLSWTKTSSSSTPLLSSPSASTAKFKTLSSNSKKWEIQINEVKKSDEGTYYCNAEINGHAVSDHVSIRVTGRIF